MQLIIRTCIMINDVCWADLDMKTLVKDNVNKRLKETKDPGNFFMGSLLEMTFQSDLTDYPPPPPPLTTKTTPDEWHTTQAA